MKSWTGDELLQVETVRISSAYLGRSVGFTKAYGTDACVHRIVHGKSENLIKSS